MCEINSNNIQWKKKFNAKQFFYRDRECGAFYVKNGTTCYMVPKLIANHNIGNDEDLIYYIKEM